MHPFSGWVVICRVAREGGGQREYLICGPSRELGMASVRQHDNDRRPVRPVEGVGAAQIACDEVPQASIVLRVVARNYDHRFITLSDFLKGHVRTSFCSNEPFCGARMELEELESAVIHFEHIR